jgi:hypothetical protein
MFDLPRACFLFLIILLMLPGVPPVSSAGSAITDQKVELVEEEVLEILSRSNDYLASLKQFQVKAEFGFDVLQETGQKIEFGSHQEITMQRPDRLRIDFSRRGGDHGSVVYDGQEVVLFNPEEGVYAKAPFKGEVDSALDFLAKELERPVPLKDFLASNPHDALLEKIESGLYVGEAMINGTLCDHLAMRNDRVDFQLWIAQGDVPLPRRIVITHKNEEGQPQFWGQFLNWETSPEISTGTFSYSPPEGAERIPFAVVDVEMRDKGGQK